MSWFRRASLGVRSRRVGAVVSMTIAEAVGAFLWMRYVAGAKGDGGVYAFPVVVAGGVFLIGLALEDVFAHAIVSGVSSINPWRSIGLAVTEVVVWTQWANIVLTGMWSRTGIGPAFVVLASLLTLQHSVETNLSYGETPFQLRHGVTAAIEGIAATAGWVLLQEQYPVVAFVAVGSLLLIEHGYRLSEVVGADRTQP